MVTRPVEYLDAPPALAKTFTRALVPSRASGPPTVPEQAVRLTNQRQDLDRLAAYTRVCGFTLRDQVPPTWLHTLAFPLHVHLLSDPSSSVGLVGAVHVSNTMTLHRPVMSTERLEVSVHLDNLRPHKRGALVDVMAQIDVDGETVWDGVSTYLSSSTRVPGTPSPTDRTEFSPAAPQGKWRLPGDLGKQYRQVSGDPNPIHTSRLAAKTFGFPRPVAHGMWTHSKALATIEPRLPSAYTASVDFVKPIFLPSSVGFRAWQAGGITHVAVTSRSGVKPHLLMSVKEN